jgi:hypothetical protein
LEAHLRKKVPKEQRCPGIKVVVKVIRIGPTLVAPVVERKPQDKLTSRSQDSVDFVELAGWVERVFESMVRDNNVSYLVG